MFTYNFFNSISYFKSFWRLRIDLKKMILIDIGFQRGSTILFILGCSLHRHCGAFRATIISWHLVHWDTLLIETLEARHFQWLRVLFVFNHSDLDNLWILDLQVTSTVLLLVLNHDFVLWIENVYCWMVDGVEVFASSWRSLRVWHTFFYRNAQMIHRYHIVKRLLFITFLTPLILIVKWLALLIQSLLMQRWVFQSAWGIV